MNNLPIPPNTNDPIESRVRSDGRPLSPYQGDRSNQLSVRPSMDEVDELADELVAEYNTPAYRGWYCALINQFGIATIQRWRELSRRGTYPGRLFSTYASNAQKRHGKYQATTPRELPVHQHISTDVTDIDEDMTEEEYGYALEIAEKMYRDKDPLALTAEDLKDIPF